MTTGARAEYIEDDGLAALHGIRHGFFTRNGGVSTGIYTSLNAGTGSDDTPENVAENLRRVSAEMGTSPRKLLTLHQCHSTRVVTVDAAYAPEEKPQADGWVTAERGVALGILTADCAPVLFADAQAQVIGACHAGWKGAFGNIMEQTLLAMERLGAARERVVAAIGPCIAQESYEVGPEFHDLFVATAAANVLFFEPSSTRSGYHHFDLPAYIRHHLQLCGVAQANMLAKDTCLAENAFFSNRRRNLRGEADYGRQVSVIMLEP